MNSVRAVQLVTEGGDILELTRSREPELFSAVFGGYGGLGAITEVELELETNSRIERVVQDFSLDDYPAFFLQRVLPDPGMVLHNADLRPPSFDAPRAISWVNSAKPVTQQERLIARGRDYSHEKNAIWAITELPGAERLRMIERTLHEQKAVVWRNYEASADVASLEPRTRIASTYLLQEYFVPLANFVPFANEMARILRTWHVNALNVSIRHSPADTESLLKWAPTDVFSFVLYYKQRNSERASSAVTVWTRELIDAALRNGGRYYLPYRLDATRAQFEQAYPEAHAFAALKERIDSSRRFTNRLLQKYLPVV